MKDSIGNELPDSHIAPWQQIGGIQEMVSIQAFRLEVANAMDRGFKVVYDKEQKQATVYDENEAAVGSIHL